MLIGQAFAHRNTARANAARERNTRDTMATYDNIPLTWNDPLLSGATNSGSVTLQNGGTLSYKSITDTGAAASVVGRGSFTLDHVRIDSREGVRIGGSGDINISNSYLESTGARERSRRYNSGLCPRRHRECDGHEYDNCGP